MTCLRLKKSGLMSKRVISAFFCMIRFSFVQRILWYLNYILGFAVFYGHHFQVLPVPEEGMGPELGRYHLLGVQGHTRFLKTFSF